MQELHIDHSDLGHFADLFKQAPAIIKAEKKAAIAAAAPKMKAVVDQEIGGTGRVRSWQEQYVGSKGFYAAVRPRAKTYAESKGLRTYEERRTMSRLTSAGGYTVKVTYKDHKRPSQHPTYPVGYITNAINSGHRAGAHGWVNGKQFYQRAQKAVEQVAQETAEQIVHAVIEHLEG